MDSGLENVEGVVLVLLVVGFLLWWLVHVLSRSRPEFRVGLPLGVGFGLRMAAIAGIGLTGLASTLRGGDETTFLSLARVLAAQPFGRGDWPHGPYQLHTVLFSLEDRLGFLTVGAMRIVQVGIALAGVILIVAAVHDLAGGKAARLATWIIAFEPASIFFNSALHKEPNMELASGLVVFGGTMLWKRLDIRGIFLFALGGVIAVETRSYAGWFLVSAAVLISLHASIRSLRRPMRAMPLIYAIAAIAFLATPAILTASSKSNLQVLQQSQNANAAAVGNTSCAGQSNCDNLALEQVDFSTRGAIIKNLPQRIRDVILRPYPWQLGDTSQRFGAIGTMFAYVILLLLIRFAWITRGKVFAHAGPLLYPMLFMLVAYALAAGNAGTAFRYRTHLVTLGIAAMAILRTHALEVRRQRQEQAAVARQGTIHLRPPATSPV